MVFCDEHLSQHVCIKCSPNYLLRSCSLKLWKRYYYPVKQEPTPTPWERNLLITWHGMVATGLQHIFPKHQHGGRYIQYKYVKHYYAMLGNKLKQAVSEMLQLVRSAKEALWKWISCDEVWQSEAGQTECEYVIDRQYCPRTWQGCQHEFALRILRLLTKRKSTWVYFL